MANVNGFTIFPPARVPRLSMPDPTTRKPSLKTVAVTDTFKESVVIALEEIPVPDVPQEHINNVRTQSTVTEGQLSTSSPLFRHGIPPPPPPPPLPQSKTTNHYAPAVGGLNSHHGSPEPGSISSAATLVPPAMQENTMPIKSMFPVYNPDVRLSRQEYFPQVPVAAYDPRQHIADSWRLSGRNLMSASVRGSVASRPHLASVIDIPLDNLNFHAATFSSQEDLEKLWDLSSNPDVNATTVSFDLEMARTEEATFTFGSSNGAPFYSITTYDTAEIGLSKINPQNQSSAYEVMLATVEKSSRRSPPNDGLVSYLFPKMAAALASHQSDALARDYDLSPTDRDEIEEAAMERAAGQEASNLRWSVLDQRYELEHPAVARKARETNFTMSPLSPQGRNKPVIHITVATSDESSPDKPIILVTCPSSLRSPTTTIETDSTTAQEPVTDMPLASLDFNGNSLHIEAKNILEVMPSLFAIDSVVAALLVVAVADHDANAAMGGMNIRAKPSPPPKRSSWAQQSSSTPRVGPLYATIAEREEAEEEARVAAKSHKKSMKNKIKPARLSALSEQEVDLEAGRTWYGKSKAKKPKKSKKIVINEFDLEKLSHYQSGSRKGQELPAVTRGALNMMISVLKFVVWLLTSIVQFLAWMMVSVTRGVTSEKF